MTCSLCNEKIVYKNLCKKHFSEYFEKKVIDTVKKFKLLKKSENIVVAASGGKDSTTILYILKTYGYNITALAINEGIKDYRDISLEMLKKFCNQQKIKLRIVTFKEEFQNSLDEMLKKTNKKPCTLCGVFRRNLLNRFSKEYDVIVTGHNLDDEAQAVLMNLIKNNVSALQRQGPISGIIQSKGFTKRVKPLYYCSEEEVLHYSSINNLIIDFNCCPNVGESFRLRLKRILNNAERKKPKIKKNIIDWFLNYKQKLVADECTKNKTCKFCGENTTRKICKSCEYKEIINVC